MQDYCSTKLHSGENDFTTHRMKSVCEHGMCTESRKTLLLVKSGKRIINPLFGTTCEEVLLSRLTLCYSMEYSIYRLQLSVLLGISW
jgi:hypothetical protein